MDAHQPPVPRARRILNDAALLTLSATLAFCIWFGGGWLLASQVALTADNRSNSSMSTDGQTFEATTAPAPFELDVNAGLNCLPDTWATPGEGQTTGY